MKQKELEAIMKEDGYYLIKYDHSIDTDFWTSEDEVVTFLRGKAVTLRGLKIIFSADLIKSVTRVKQIKPLPNKDGVCQSIWNDCFVPYEFTTL